MGVSAVPPGASTMWVQTVGLALGLVLVVAGLWLARAFRNADPNRPQNPDRRSRGAAPRRRRAPWRCDHRGNEEGAPCGAPSLCLRHMLRRYAVRRATRRAAA